ncbi:scabin-related ADP-ribosyltransferase, partial [Bacillus cereus group sp. Bce019]|uniref:scabin-related ADP-ribosyltransferase n=1 Tax=Bacillus cereus group sp. Bce019 TaxID=3445247 RepID=UPI003F27DB3B
LLLLTCAGKNGYVYEIETPRGLDVNKYLGTSSPFPEQMEFSVPGGVMNSEIKGVYSLKNGSIVDYISNPNFGGK